MRRILLVLPIPLITGAALVAALFAPPTGAAIGKATIRPVTLAAVRSVQKAHLHRHRPAPSPTFRALRAAAAAKRLTVAELRSEWQKVAMCEVGGNWSMTGSLYSGIGFSNATWSSYGGVRYAPLAGLATRDEQILIGMKVNNGWVPDQFGCQPGGW